jgi:hypothetical protein
MKKPTLRQVLSSNRWREKALEACSRRNRKDTESTLTPMVEFRRYAMAFLTETTSYMDFQDEEFDFDEATSETVQHQQETPL